jgi:two-component system cell cycle sensor histidine kinase/response regulator CckA
MKPDKSYEGIIHEMLKEMDENKTKKYAYDLVGLHQQITELKRVEKKYRELYDTIRDGIASVDLNSHLIEFNNAFRNILGYDEDEIYRLTSEDITPEKWHHVEAKIFKEQVFEKGYSDIYEKEYIKKDGTLVPVEMRTYLIRDENSVPTGMWFFVRDISKRKQVRDALRESEERYQTLVENVNIGIFRNTGDPQGNFIQANPASAKIFGFDSVDDFMKINVSDLYQNPEERKLFIEEITHKGFVKNKEEQLRKKDGTFIWASVTAKAQYNEHGDIKWIDGVVEDITERKKLEAQLIQAQKMEAIGNLAGGIAHDFNNILTAMLGYVSLLQMDIREDTHLKKFTDQIIIACDRAATLTQSLLTFSRKQIISPRPANLNTMIRELEKLLLRVIGEDIELKTLLAAENLIVMEESGQIVQVLMNLATNARDAMPEGGLLTISTELMEVDDEYIHTHGYGKPGKYAVITVSDTGEGMDEKTRERIFEPFFTTKEAGKGTGLGLSMVYGIITQHNGYINCYSEPKRGTTFRIYRPLIETDVEEKRTEGFSIIKEGTETVLIAEDDVGVRVSIKETLKGFGYKVIEAVDGEDAIEKFNKNKDRVQLILLDVIMPRKNGNEAYEAMKKVMPDIKVIFMSGYTADIIQKRGLLKDEFNFILKPVSPTELLRKLRQVLDKG